MAKKADKKEKETPLMKQYNAIKAKHPGALLLFRVGDFYETFGEDAITASKILDIVLTKRSNGSASAVELAGFPHHALDTYLPRLVKAGQRVAICDQLEDPKAAKGIVKRGITELVTPGVSFNDNVLNVKRNNYLASVHFEKDAVGVAFLDISTGEFLTAQGDFSYIEKLLQSFAPSEVIYCRIQREVYQERLGDLYTTFQLEDWVYTHEFGYERLTKHFGTKSLKGFGIENMKAGIIAAGAALYYLEATEHHQVSHISTLSRIEEDKYVWLDKFTIRNLELLYPQQEGGVPLIETLDRSVTPMGARLMKKWTVLPLKNKQVIDERLNTVAFFTEEEELMEDTLQPLRQIGDIERLISKVAVGRINPREMVQLKKALKNTLPIKDILEKTDAPQVQKLADRLNRCDLLIEKIEKELDDNPPLNATQGGLVKEGIDTELDELRKIAFSGKDYLKQIQQRETERTGIPSLKIGYNKVFGYYLEVRNAHKDKVPSEWIRKSTLVSSERYITEELKTYEEKILTAESQIQVIESRIFTELICTANEYVAQVQQNAGTLAILDCLLSFAQNALEYNYAKPTIKDDKKLLIKEGRHPVIERQLPIGEEYIPNDIKLSDDDQQILIITGPNMAGKSALLRQTALIVLMAQMGSFVPAKSAEIGLVDKVFTRVGASDNLSKGESTFMVEMTETASILNNLSDRSLILMDEIGRGTSTYDGISIAWSIVEYLHNHKGAKAKTLFATHYHELNQLAEDFPRIKNYNVAVKEYKGKVIFMRKLQEGGSEHSFGIHVAQLAGMPSNIVDRANEILHHLEQDKITAEHKERVKEVPKNNYQLSIFDATDPAAEKLKKTLKDLDVNTLTPIEALMKLNELKGLLKN
ncbi:DNA mismatch repair protein MutS [Limibacter armeniacum]|uniref:DNA mismatch repair protein MutS n=1 Tax=Limibacter armeniacum TaxID=466084 RepID=UPI0038CBFA6F